MKTILLIAVLLAGTVWTKTVEEAKVAEEPSMAMGTNEENTETVQKRRARGDCRPGIPGNEWWECLTHPNTGVPVQVICRNNVCLVQCEVGGSALCRLQRARWSPAGLHYGPTGCSSVTSCFLAERRPDIFQVWGLRRWSVWDLKRPPHVLPNGVRKKGKTSIYSPL